MRLVILDGTESGGGFLEFDLPEVLAALGERALNSTWRAPYVEWVSKDEQEVPPIQAMAAGAAVKGRDLVAGIEHLCK